MRDYNEKLSQVREVAQIQTILEASEKGVDLSALRIGPIDDSALEKFQAWGSTNYFEWEDVPRWKRRHPEALDVALWSGPELCGLCYAEPNGTNVVVKVILLEGKPDSTHPLKQRVAAISMSTLLVYCDNFGFEAIEIECPDSGAVPLYREIGFEFDAERRLVMPALMR